MSALYLMGPYFSLTAQALATWRKDTQSMVTGPGHFDGNIIDQSFSLLYLQFYTILSCVTLEVA